MKSAKCRECGFVGWADAEFCKRCGASVASPPIADYQEQANASQGAIAPPTASQALEPSSEPQTVYYAPGTNAFPEDLKTGWAIASLVFGIANFLLFGIFVIPIIVGIVISVVALKKIKQDPFEYGGKAMAIAGLVTNIVSVVVLIPVLIIVAIAVPNLLAARRAANEGSAIKSLRTIHSAQATWQATKGQGKFGTLSELHHDNLISGDLAGGMRHGYRFTIELVADGDGYPGFTAVGVPVDYGWSGRRSFYIDETGVIRAVDGHGTEATKYDPPLNSETDYSSERSARRASSNSDY